MTNAIQNQNQNHVDYFAHEQTPLVVATTTTTTKIKAHVSIEAEASPLPYCDPQYDGEDEPPSHQQFHGKQQQDGSGTATVGETMTNLAKTCMGTGCLALPFATKQGGIVLTVIGMMAIAMWNVIAAQRLVACYELLYGTDNPVAADASLPSSSSSRLKVHHRTHRRSSSLIMASNLPPPPRGTATLGTIAWYALGGPAGLWLLDSLTVILLLGIIIAYNDAIRSFLQGTPLTTHSDILDAGIVAVLIAPLAMVPDLGYLTKTSAAGLTVLGMALLVVTGYGMWEGVEEDSTMTTSSSYADDNSMTTPIFPVSTSTLALQWWPLGMAGVSQWFGCCVFGFGIVPLTFNFRESMAEPAKLPQATFTSLLVVAVIYMAIGVGLLALYPSIESDILSELPNTGWLPVLTRLAMVVVIMATAPLLIVPCAEIIEGKLAAHNHPYSHEDEEDDGVAHHHQPVYDKAAHHRLQVQVRFGICFGTVAISVVIPGFVGVLTFVGCFCVAFVSFCIPPLLHLVLEYRRLFWNGGESQSITLTATLRRLWIDIVLLTWGLTATGISTTYVFRHSLDSATEGTPPEE